MVKPGASWCKHLVLWHRVNELEGVPHSPPQAAPEALEDQMRELLRDGGTLDASETVPKYDAREGEEDGGAVGEVGEHESVGDAAVLVEDDEVGDAVRPARICELLHDVVSSVDPRGIWDAKPHFLQRELQV